MKLKNKVAVVTGGARGIGSAIALHLAREGAKIVISDIASEESAQPTLSSLLNEGIEAKYFKGDASSFNDAQKTIDFAVSSFGTVDIMVNNAGITRDNLLLRMTEKDWDDVIQINLKSVFNFSKAVIKPMMGQRSGKIINIASVVGIMGNAGQANYVASKAGVIGLTKTLAKEFAGRNIQVNAIAPGFIETEMTAKLNQAQKDAIMNLVPLKKMGQPSDVAKAVAFLASSDADYITGQVICVDGGMIM
ncbi:MAG: 3-oxoacyl-[acyl-carrier-protein] reductase [Bacteroidetes bacterium]|nr:3-oxoacyl-[acyl-carrier-protein] reductase [Bacteroidota bacterium]MBU2585173.1 3-oxoacyl-[acyl-carrier-protein] reductase [Bacteroidota bacterium]